MKWFNNPQTLEELKKEYKRLALKHHPDRGGDVKDMQEINSEYDFLFARLKDKHTTATGEHYTKETNEKANEFRDIVSKLINLDEINIELCGSWIWLTGATFKHKDILKHLKFKFSNSKKAWYYHSEGYRKSTKKTYSLDEIRDLYGSETVQHKPQLKLSII